jgi:hypothetical protein
VRNEPHAQHQKKKKKKTPNNFEAGTKKTTTTTIPNNTFGLSDSVANSPRLALLVVVRCGRVVSRSLFADLWIAGCLRHFL